MNDDTYVAGDSYPREWYGDTQPLRLRVLLWLYIRNHPLFLNRKRLADVLVFVVLALGALYIWLIVGQADVALFLAAWLGVAAVAYTQGAAQ